MNNKCLRTDMNKTKEYKKHNVTGVNFTEIVLTMLQDQANRMYPPVGLL
jgi:hypothetical protein